MASPSSSKSYVRYWLGKKESKEEGRGEEGEERGARRRARRKVRGEQGEEQGGEQGEEQGGATYLNRLSIKKNGWLARIGISPTRLH